tara:strand:+ start:32 stop:1003 length:972 start_codon:yes stop_codon:yes gene_type:complete
MSKFLRVPTGDYKIEVRPNGNIILDTNSGESETDSQQGKVIVTGDLIVQGNTTTVVSENMSINDNIIILNSGDNGSGVTLGVSGIQINRGNLSDVYIVYDESFDQFAFRLNSPQITGAAVGIRTNTVESPSGNLLLKLNSNSHVRVSNDGNYETGLDADDLTNKQYVDDAITTAFATVFLTQIGSGTEGSLTTVKTLDFEATAEPSKVEVSIDNNIVAEFYEDRFELSDIRIIGTMIETTASNQDLILSSPGTGNIVIDDTLEIRSVPGIGDSVLEPSFPLDGARLYVSTPQYGGTGLFIANSQQIRDEVISNNKSLIYSMVF